VLAALALLTAVVGVVTTYDDAPRPAPDADRTGAWASSPTDPGRRLLSLEGPASASAPAAAPATVRVDLADRQQVWRGTGAALTDASVELLDDAPGARRLLFDPEAEDGARLTWLRLPLTATDMSPQAWTWGWDGTEASPSPQAEAALATVRQLAEVQPDLRVVASPWTAPAWMKTPEGVRGGALRDEEVGQYAAMLVAQADALREAGVPLTALTLGNEPGYSADYPSMTMTDEQQAGLGRLVGPQLHERALELWAVDHNWADRPRHDAVLAGAPGAFDAAAFHCYAGRPEQMAGVAAPPVVDECSGTTSSWAEAFEWQSRNLVADSVSAGATGLLMWNLALDPTGGPRDVASAQGCASCRGLVTVDGDRVEPGPEFYLLAHLARAADPGARVVGSSATPGLATAAFANPDGTLGVMVHNGTDDDRLVRVDAGGDGGSRHGVRAGELLTVRTRLR
jgi:glucosylceramidase